MKTLTISVLGVPVGKGSLKAFMPKGGKFPVITHDSAKTKPWASAIGYAAAQAVTQSGWQCVQAYPVHVRLEFRMPRPKNHYGTGKNAAVLKPGAPQYHVSKPDIDKLSRLALDALTGIVWRDDNQVAVLQVCKSYVNDANSNESTGILITVDAFPNARSEDALLLSDSGRKEIAP